jgi:hypothetical protein
MEKMKSIDTEIRHVTKSDANLFKELGFENDLAQQYHEQSQKQINDMRVLKEHLKMKLPIQSLTD